MDWSQENLEDEWDVRGIPATVGVVRYVAGCIKRERERIARILESAASLQEAAEAIRDESMDKEIFQWRGPEATLK